MSIIEHWSKIKEDDKALILLAYLSSFFKHLAATSLYERDSTNLLEDVTFALLSNKMCNKSVQGLLCKNPYIL